MKVSYISNGSDVYVFKMDDKAIADQLEPMVYTLRYTNVTGYYLEITKAKLETPAKIYGNVNDRVQQCLRTYADRNASTGILMTGDKGTGKSLLMSLLANAAIDELELPVIMVTEAAAGTQFLSFIESLGECCIIFDEFGKMYESSNHRHEPDTVPQSSLLSLMDGVDKTKRLMIITENSEMDINEFILNRPGRVYYHFRYRKLEEVSIRGYCEDHGVSERIIVDIIDLSRRSRIFSFDMLQSIVEEHLRFAGEIEDIVEDLNVDVREDSGPKLEILKVVEKETGQERQLYDTNVVLKPKRYDSATIKLIPNGITKDEWDAAITKDADAANNYDYFYISESDLAFESKGQQVYETSKYTVVVKDVPPSYTDYSIFF